MNYIRHLNSFYNFVKKDDQLTSSHLSLYMALFQYWNYNRFQNPFPIYRDNLMQLSKIGSKNTYHKCIKDLHLAKYIYYHQPASKFQPVKISIIRLDKKEDSTPYKQLDFFVPTEQVSLNSNPSTPTKQSPPLSEGDLGGGQCPIIGTSPCTDNDTDSVPNLTDAGTDFDTVPVPKMGHNIKHKQINIINERVENSLTQKIFSKNNLLQEGINKMAGVPNSVHTEWSRSALAPTLSEVEEFFKTANYPATEAQKFFNHYQSNGWLVGGKTPMKDWHSSAHKWMLNVPNFKPAEKAAPGKKQNTTLDHGKNYGEPL